MSTLQQLGLDKWSVEDRLKLIGELWDSIGDEQMAFPLSPEQEADLNRRLDEDDANPDEGLTLEEVKAMFRKES